MADVKLTALTELTAPTSDDMLLVVDTPSGSPNSKKVSVSNLVDRRYLGVPFTDPTLQSFTWTNQGSASVDTTYPGILLAAPGATVQNVRIRQKSAPTAPYSITIAFTSLSDPRGAGQSGHQGLMFRNSSDGKLTGILYYPYSNGQQGLIGISAWNSATSWSTNYLLLSVGWMPFGSSPLWFRITDDGTTNKSYWFSYDGFTWIKAYEHARTTFTTPDQVAFVANAPDATYPMYMRLLSWLET